MKHVNIFFEYIKNHKNEIKFVKEDHDYGHEYVFKLKSPKKFLGIFPIYFVFSVCGDLPMYVDGDLGLFIDVSHWYSVDSVRLDFSQDMTKDLRCLLKIFQDVYLKYQSKVNNKKWQNICKGIK